MARLRAWLYELIENTQSPAGKAVNLVLMALIAANILALMLETVDSIYQPAASWFQLFNLISVLIFSGEYLLRVWICVENPKYAHPIRGRLAYAVSPMALVDLIAILPFYLPFFGIADMRHLRAARLFRIFKIMRYSRTLNLFQKVISEKREELTITLFFLLLLLLFSASMMYFVEHQAQPEAFSSIPATMWWAIATLTTVGYGDVYPITPLGRLLASSIAVMGIGMFALPTGIMGAAFVEEVEQNKKNKAEKSEFHYCPHCGKNLPSA
jgi:voltage-gated potassium channel